MTKLPFLFLMIFVVHHSISFASDEHVVNYMDEHAYEVTEDAGQKNENYPSDDAGYSFYTCSGENRVDGVISVMVDGELAMKKEGIWVRCGNIVDFDSGGTFCCWCERSFCHVCISENFDIITDIFCSVCSLYLERTLNYRSCLDEEPRHEERDPPGLTELFRW